VGVQRVRECADDCDPKSLAIWAAVCIKNKAGAKGNELWYAKSSPKDEIGTGHGSTLYLSSNWKICERKN